MLSCTSSVGIAIDQLVDDGGEEVVGIGLGLLELGLEVVAQGHELIHLGDDALLLCKRRQSE